MSLATNKPGLTFHSNKIVTIKTDKGHITLSKDKLIVQEGEVRAETPIKNEKDFKSRLKEYFDIQITGDD